MSEETHDAAIRGPVAINTAVVTSGLIGWMLTITFCFCLGDLESTIATPTGMPVGVAMVDSRSPRQKQKVMVSIQPIRPEVTTAVLMATGPRIAASWVSSDMLGGVNVSMDEQLRDDLLGGSVVIRHGPGYR